MRLKWVAMKMPGPHWGAGQTLRNRCTLPESSTCIATIEHHSHMMLLPTVMHLSSN